MDERRLLIAIALCAALAVLGAILAGGSWRPWHSALRKPRLPAPLPAFAVANRGSRTVSRFLLGLSLLKGPCSQRMCHVASTEGADDTSNNNRHDPHLLDTSRLSRADQSRRTRAPSPVIREAA